MAAPGPLAPETVGAILRLDSEARTGESVAMDLLAVVTAIVGTAVVAVILWDAFETILVPRRIGRRVRLTRYFYLITWRLWRALARRIRKPSRREAVLGFYGPLSLLLLLACWAAGMVLGFTLLQMAALGADGFAPGEWTRALYMSGETFFTLGFGDVTPATGAGRLCSVLEAGMGFGFLGTVVGYLPTMYAAFSQREIEISLLDARAGSPPTAAEFIARLPRDGGGALSAQLLRDWERWSAQLLETHISYPQLAYYRSQHLNQSWLATLTAILDSSALILAGVDSLPEHQARLTFAMARHAMVDITQVFVTRRPESFPDRLEPERLRRLRERLANSSYALPASAEYEQRLDALRLTYEPYAQALAAYLLFDLAPWVHDGERRDNWRGGPWDKVVATAPATHRASEDHF